jgi:aminoglycoside phosphotransferase (APT) family kinase protein
MDDLPGLDLSALTRWLDGSAPDLRSGPLQASLITGGRSNLTYRVGDGTNLWALRRPPLGHVLPTAHDMRREFRVISALSPMGIPVPAPVILCADETVLGVPFYLMNFVDGVVIDTAEAVADVPHDAAPRLGKELIVSLIELHEVDLAVAGLADFGRPQGFLQRQVARWHTQWQSSETRPLPAEGRLVDRLAAAVPDSGPASVVHGDYRLSNVIYNHAMDSVAAIVDWEMATVGDPLADLGLLYVYHELAATGDSIMPRMTASGGFLSADELLALYAHSSTRDLSAMSWYIAFGKFKLAVIAEGIAARHLQGLTVGAGFDKIGEIVPELVDSALAVLSQ